MFFQRIYRDVDQVYDHLKKTVLQVPAWVEMEDMDRYLLLRIIYCARNTENRVLKAELILRGIYAFKIPLDPFPTEQEYLNEVVRICEEKMQLEKQRELLQELALKMQPDPTYGEIGSPHQEIISKMFGIDLVVEKDGSIQMAPTFLKEAHERLDNEIRILDEKIGQRNLQARGTAPNSRYSLLSKTVFTVASIAAIAIGGLFLYRRKSK